MRLVTTMAGAPGIVDADAVVDVSTVFADLGEAAGWREILAADALERLSDLPAGLPRSALSVTPLATPVGNPGKIVAAPVNYRSHQDEMSWPTSVAELGVFLKATSSLLGPGGDIQLPYTDVRTDQEGELALVIGRRARHVGIEEALDYVAGYTCLLDITIRSSEDRSARKSFDTFTPVGPWIATPEEVGDPDDLALRCWVDDELRQDARTSSLIFSVPLLIAYASSVMTLEPGDIIATGTPEGVGPIGDADRIAVEIERVGRLEVGVSGLAARPYSARPTAANS